MLTIDDVVGMPTWMVALPCITMLMANSLLTVQGQCFLEVFGGSGIISLGIMMASVPLWRPWDVKYGEQFCVNKHGHVLRRLARLGKLAATHMGTPCGSGTMARDVQLRSWDQPYGADGLGSYHAEIVRVGNTLIEFSVELARDLMEAGCYFSIENPWPCWTWVHPWVIWLWHSVGVILTTLVVQRYAAPYDTRTGLLHNFSFSYQLGRMKGKGA